MQQICMGRWGQKRGSSRWQQGSPSPNVGALAAIPLLQQPPPHSLLTLLCPFPPLPTHTPRFIALADAIEAAFPNVVVEGNPTGPGRPGAFEVTLPDGAVLFSKLSSGGWPEAGSVVDAIGSSAACGLPQQ